MKEQVSELAQVLKENILPFWMDKMVDDEQGGFIGQIDGLGQRNVQADKSIILNTRILWTFSAVYQQLKEDRYKHMADRAFDYLLENFVDGQYGGVYWMLDAQGQVKDSKKQVYAQAFMIYALSEYYKISKEEKALSLSKTLFGLIEKHSLDKENNGYLEAFDQQWRLLEDLRLSDKDANEKKTMNTHLHVLEAYTNLYRLWKDDVLKEALKNLIEVFMERFIDDRGHFLLFFDEAWISKSNKISYGHDIEGSWLLYEAAEVLGEEGLLEKVKIASLKMADVFIQKGISPEHAVYNESEDGVYEEEFHWWPQAEAMVGLVNAWQLTGKAIYLEKTAKIWAFTKERIIDWENGEWYWGISKDGKILTHEDKAGPWKCPYHNGRALLEVMERLKAY